MQVTKETNWPTATKSFLHHLQLEAKRFTLKQLFVKGSSHTLYL